MPFLAAPVIAGLSLTWGGLILTTASLAYQVNRTNKMKRQQAAAAEARKGFEVTRVDQVETVPVLYGYTKVGATATSYDVSSKYTHADSTLLDKDRYSPNVYSSKYDSNHHVQFDVEGTEGEDIGGVKNVVDLTSVRIRVVWDGTTVYDKTTTSADVDGDYVHADFQALRDGMLFVEAGAYRYYIAPTHHRINSPAIVNWRMPITRFEIGGRYRLFDPTTGTSKSDLKNSALYVQYVIGFEGIDEVLAFDMDGVRYQNKRFTSGNTGWRVNYYYDGGTADAMATANGFSSNNTFTNCAYASCLFHLNRDDPQWRDVPGFQSYVKGQRIHGILKVGNNYILSGTKSFSNNPARVLLDYLTNDLYGRGLPLSRIDLKSFYEAQVICETVVMQDALVEGFIYGGYSRRDIFLYEFNDALDTSQPIRDNVDRILESMGQSALVWSGGKYKLSVPYTTEAPSVANGKVDPTHVFDDSTIIKEEIDLTWTNAQDKFNQVTVRFKNAFKNFKEDTATWPKSLSSVRQIYLAEDNGQPLTTELEVPGIATPYHALAKAEEMVRLSRSSHVLKCTLSKNAMTLEPGDFFILSSEIAQIEPTVYRVEEVKVTAELTAEIVAYSFNHETLAWNVEDNVPYGRTVLVDNTILPPRNVLYIDDEVPMWGNSSGKIKWNYSLDDTVSSYIVEASDDDGATWEQLGETSGKRFNIQGLNTGVYKFRVRSKTLIGGMSEAVVAVTPGGQDDHTIQRSTADQVAVIYADSPDIATNVQSYSLDSNLYVAYYVYGGDKPTLPIRSDIEFSLFIGPAGADGADGVQGIDGQPGENATNVALLQVYKRAGGTPGTPVGGSFDFTNATLVSPSGWSATVPSGAGELFISHATATAEAGGSGLDDSLTWSSPTSFVRDGADGITGEDGKSTYQAIVFRRAPSRPSAPTGGSYNFGTNVLTPPTGWSYDIPDSDGDPAWSCNYQFVITGDTGSSSATQWTTPRRVVDDGVDGQPGADGISTHMVSVFKRSNTEPSVPGGGSYNFGTQTIVAPSGWSTSIPNVGTGSTLYAATALASVQGTTGTDSSLSWSVVALAANGANGVDGPSGNDGKSVAQVQIFKRASSAPATPTDGSFNFTTNILTPPSGWSSSVPTGDAPVYSCLSTASIVGTTGVDSTLLWSDPEVLATNGSDGIAGTNGVDGKSTYQATVFRRASSEPAQPSGGSFNFETNTLTPPSGWSSSVPTGATSTIWACNYQFQITGDLGTDNAGQWSEPSKLGEKGDTGEDGVSTFLVSVFRRRSSKPGTPSGGSYNFGTNTVTAPSNWSTSPPDGDNPLWIATALASIQGTTGTDSSLSWTVGELARHGDVGPQGPTGPGGSTGDRGAGWFRVGFTNNPATRTQYNLNYAWDVQIGLTKVKDDVIIAYQYSGANGAVAWLYDGSNWVLQADFIDGNLLVNGTVKADHLDVDSMETEGLAVFGDTLKSSNFNTSNETGWRIRSGSNNDALFYGDVSSGDRILNRNLLINSGQFVYNSGIVPGSSPTFHWVNTGIKISDGDVWNTSRRTLMMTARIVPAYITGSPSDLTMWYAHGEVFNNFAWYGGNWGARTVPHDWTRDPAVTVQPSWSNGTSQRVFARITTNVLGNTINGPITVYWKVFEVT